MIKRIAAFFLLFYVGLWCLQQSNAAGWLPLAQSSGGGGCSTVLRDNSTSATAAGPTTSMTASMLVGSGTQRALVAGLMVFWSSTVGTLTVVWDAASTNQAMTAITGATATSSDGAISVLYGLVAPTSGTKILTVTGTQSFYHNISLLSVTCANQTGGITTFKNGTGATGAITPSTITFSSGTTNLAYALASSFGPTYTGVVSPGTSIGVTNGDVASESQYITGAASITATETMSTNGNWSSAAVSIGP
jgi:hypothetical protein